MAKAFVSPQLYDYDEELDKIKQSEAWADQLRQQATKAPREGKMVGRWYVGNNWADVLAPALQGAMSGYAGAKASQQRGELTRRAQQEAADWISQRPQARTETRTIPGQELQGPTPEGGPLMGLDQTQTRTIQPTDQEQLMWAQRGANNPLTKALAAQYGADVLVNAPKREEERVFKKETAAQAHLDKLDLAKQAAVDKLEQLNLQLESKALDRESREKIAQMIDATRDHIAHLMSETQITIAGMRSEASKYAADQRADAASNKPPKPVPNTIIKTMQGAEQSLEGIENANKAFKPEYGGVGGYASKLSGTWNPLSGKDSEAAANWWKDYENQAALVERHEKFGTALSAGEQGAWRAATIAPGMKAETIKANLETRQKLARKVYEKSRQDFIKTGYPQIEDAFPSRGPIEDEPAAPTPTVPGQPTHTGAVPVRTPEEARKLPPGTRIVLPNGEERTTK